MGHATSELEIHIGESAFSPSLPQPGIQVGTRPDVLPFALDLPEDVALRMQRLVQEQADSAYQKNFGEGNAPFPRLDLLRVEASWIQDGAIGRNEENEGNPRYDFDGKSLDEAMYDWIHEPGRDITDILNFNEARRWVANQARRTIDERGTEQGYLDPQDKAARNRAVAVTDDAMLETRQARVDARDEVLRAKWATGSVPFAEKAADMGYPLMAAVAAGVDPDAPPLVRNVVRTGVLLGAAGAAIGCVSPIGVPPLEAGTPTSPPTHSFPSPSMTAIATGHPETPVVLSPTVAAALDMVYNGVFPPGFGGESTASVTTVFAADVKNSLNSVHLAPVTVEGVGAAHIITDTTGNRLCGPAFPAVIANRLAPGDRALDLQLDGTTNGVTTYKGADGSMAQVFSALPLSPGNPDVVCLTAIGTDPTRSDFSALWTVLFNTKTGLVEGLLPAYDKDQRLSRDANGNLIVNGAPVVFQHLSSLATDVPVITPPKPDTATPVVRLTATLPATEKPVLTATPAETQPTSCLDKGAWDKVITDNGFTSAQEAVKTFIEKYGAGGRVTYADNPAFRVVYENALYFGEYKALVDKDGYKGWVYCSVLAIPGGTASEPKIVSVITDGVNNGKWSNIILKDDESTMHWMTTETEARDWFKSRVGKQMTVYITTSLTAKDLSDYPTFNDFEGSSRSVMKPLTQNSYLTRFGADRSLYDRVTNSARPDPVAIADSLDPNQELGLFADKFIAGSP